MEAPGWSGQRQEFRTGLVGVAVAVALAGCGGANGAAVTVKTFQFSPSPLEIEPGTEVTWANEDDIGHTVTSGTPDDPRGDFDGFLGGAGATYSFTFADPGRHPYFCSIHPSMVGEIRVG